MRLLIPLIVTAATLPLAGCIGLAGSGERQYPLDTLNTATIDLNDNALRVWLMRTREEHAEGFMFVPEDQIADDQGMLFVFSDERLRSFWMKDTITPLDIAFARFDGTIVATHTMPALTLRGFSSIEPAMFALEVKAGTFERLGVAVGDRLEIPDDVFK